MVTPASTAIIPSFVILPCSTATSIPLSSVLSLELTFSLYPAENTKRIVVSALTEAISVPVIPSIVPDAGLTLNTSSMNTDTI